MQRFSGWTPASYVLWPIHQRCAWCFAMAHNCALCSCKMMSNATNIEFSCQTCSLRVLRCADGMIFIIQQQKINVKIHVLNCVLMWIFACINYTLWAIHSCYLTVIHHKATLTSTATVDPCATVWITLKPMMLGLEVRNELRSSEAVVMTRACQHLTHER